MIPTFKIQVRFADLDLLGHVNNAIYLSYFEMARVYYFAALLGENWDYRNKGFVLVKNEVNYLKPIFLYDKPEVKIAIVEIGNKSITLSYEILVNNVLVTTGSSILVGYNATKNETIVIAEEIKIALQKLK